MWHIHMTAKKNNKKLCDKIKISNTIKMFKIKKESGRCSWSKKETQELLALMKENHVMEQLDGKTRRNKNVYVHLAGELANKGFSKSSDQIKLKFRTLKKDFLKIKRGNSKSGSGRQTMEHFDDLNELLGDRPVSAIVGLDTTVVETMFDEDEKIPVGEMTEEFLDESLSETDELNTSHVMATSQQNKEKVPKKKRSAVQMTLLDIAADIKESQQSVLNLIKEENKLFIEEERRQYVEHVNEMKEMMTEERKATREMLLEILKM